MRRRISKPRSGRRAGHREVAELPARTHQVGYERPWGLTRSLMRRSDVVHGVDHVACKQSAFVEHGMCEMGAFIQSQNWSQHEVDWGMCYE